MSVRHRLLRPGEHAVESAEGGEREDDYLVDVARPNRLTPFSALRSCFRWMRGLLRRNRH